MFIAMMEFIEKLMEAVRRFGVFDFAVFKLSMLFVGILLGAYFSTFFMTWSGIVWVVAAVLLVTLVVRLVMCMRKD